MPASLFMRGERTRTPSGSFSLNRYPPVRLQICPGPQRSEQWGFTDSIAMCKLTCIRYVTVREYGSIQMRGKRDILCRPPSARPLAAQSDAESKLEKDKGGILHIHASTSKGRISIGAAKDQCNWQDRRKDAVKGWRAIGGIDHLERHDMQVAHVCHLGHVCTGGLDQSCTG